MDHFDIVLALARAAASGDAQQGAHLIERLRDALAAADPKQAEKLTRLLTREARRQSVAPLSLEQMRAGTSSDLLPGETLKRGTPLPHDRETATPLARIIMPDEALGEPPILTAELKDAIKDLIGEWGRTDQLAALGVQPNMRCLLYGPPGVGKTMLARYIGAQLKLPIVEARLDGLVSSFLGTTARNIGSLFDFADRYRCILFLDEFDALAKARDDSHEVGEIKRVVNTLLQCLDARGQRGFTIAATNHEHLLDAAVWRRFEARIEIPKPDKFAREQLLARFLAPIEVSPAHMKTLVWLSEGMSAADLETLIAGGKRFYVMAEADAVDEGDRANLVLAALRRLATLNGSIFSAERRALLMGSADELAIALVNQVGLKQKEAGQIVGKSQSAISRMGGYARQD